ncbi:MAG TPA: hypothetical protein VMK12_26580, partial [Anaeromyxobacteraceae bacterium]|nr:hypothetical protein [Anaeromyxobacteraceae bacterium]
RTRSTLFDGRPALRPGRVGMGNPPRSQVHAARSMPPVAAAVSQPGMPLRHSGRRACRQYSKSHHTMELTTDSDTLAATVPPDG